MIMCDPTARWEMESRAAASGAAVEVVEVVEDEKVDVKVGVVVSDGCWL